MPENNPLLVLGYIELQIVYLPSMKATDPVQYAVLFSFYETSAELRKPAMFSVLSLPFFFSIVFGFPFLIHVPNVCKIFVRQHTYLGCDHFACIPCH